MPATTEDFPVTATDKGAAAMAANPELATIALEVGHAGNQIRAVMLLVDGHVKLAEEHRGPTWSMVTTYTFLLSMNAIHALLQVFDLPGSNPLAFDDTLPTKHLRGERVDFLRRAYATHRSNGGTIGFTRNKLVAHIDSARIRKWVDAKVAAGTDVTWVVYHGPTHSEVVGTGPEEMAVNVLTAGRDGDVATVTANDFSKAVQDVAEVLKTLIEVADELEAGLLLEMNLDLRTADGSQMSLPEGLEGL